MSAAREIPAFRVEIAVSRRFLGLLSAGHLGALAIGAVLAVSTPWLMLLCLPVVSSWIWTIKRHASLGSRRAFIALEIMGERACALQLRTGEWVHGEIQATSYVLPWLIILHVAVEGHVINPRVCLFADSMARESHRRLRVRLRWARPAEVDREDAPL
jgi:toxin CptA